MRILLIISMLVSVNMLFSKSVLAWGQSLPGGSYSKSCTLCSMSGHKLSCYCTDKLGIPVRSTLYVSERCQDVVNNNGNLQCDRDYLPSGNYKASCDSCMMHGRHLSCMCRNNAGTRVKTTKYIPYNCKDVENYNGTLGCASHWHHHWHHHWRHGHHWHKVRFNENAGPIWNNDDAKTKCPAACGNAGAKWTGQWHTPQFSMNSVCSCYRWEN